MQSIVRPTPDVVLGAAQHFFVLITATFGKISCEKKLDFIRQQHKVRAVSEGQPFLLNRDHTDFPSSLKLNSGVESGRFTQQEIKNQSYLLNGSEGEVCTENLSFSYPGSASSAIWVLSLEMCSSARLIVTFSLVSQY